MSNVIIVIGRGIEGDGTLPPDPLSRVRKAVELYDSGQAPLVVMSGGWSYHLDTVPACAESTAMKNYAVELGVPAKNILEESRSKDTIGNIYFTKKEICEPHQWKNIVVVASDDQMPRIKYLCAKIYGLDYTFTFVVSERVLDDDDYQKELQHENESMIVTRHWLDMLEPGDDSGVWQLMITKHPAYMPQ